MNFTPDYEFLFTRSDSGMAILNLESNFYKVNQAFCDVTGYSETELLSMNFGNISHFEDMKRFSKAGKDLISGQINKYQAEKRFINKNGQILWIRVNLDFIEGTNNQDGYFFVQIQNINEIKKDKEQIIKNEKLLLEAQRIANIGTWEYNLSTSEMIWSGDLYKIYGLDPNRFKPDFLQSFTFLHTEDKADIEKKYNESIEQKKSSHYEYRIIRPDGQVRNIVAKAQLITDADGNNIKRIGIIQDITDLLQIENSLLEIKQRFENAFDYSSIGMALVDLKGELIEINPALCTMLGYTEEELYNNFQSISHPDDLNTELEYIEEMLNKEIWTFQLEKKYLHKKGHSIFVLLNISMVYDDQKNPMYYIFQIQDITERKILENNQEMLIKELKNDLEIIKNSGRIIPICLNCKNIQNEEGYWKQVEDYIKQHYQLEFTNKICPDCVEKLQKEIKPELVLKINKENYQVYKNGENIYLPLAEFNILSYLYDNKGKVISIEDILQNVLNCAPKSGNPDNIRTYIKRIRSKIEDNPGEPQIIKNIPRVGYRLDF